MTYFKNRDTMRNFFPFLISGRISNFCSNKIRAPRTFYCHKQKDSEIKLITDQELIAIQVNWYRDFNFTFQVSEIYNKIYNASLDMEEVKVKNKLEAELMKEVCKDNIEEGELIEQLLLLQKSKSLMQRRRGLKGEIESRIEEFVKNKKK